MSKITANTLNPIKRSRLHEKIVSQIMDLIQSGKMKSGDMLPPERELTEIFKVSRHSVREAIRILEQEKVLQSRQGSGTFVVKDENLTVSSSGTISPLEDTLLEIFQFRKLIEPQIAFLAAQNAKEEDIAHCQSIIEKQQKETEFKKMAQLDSSFHLALAKATKNSILLRIVQDINDVLAGSRGVNTQLKTRAKVSVAGHFEILAAIKEGDALAAQKAMGDHIIGIEEILLGNQEDE